jgi:adenylate kinase
VSLDEAREAYREEIVIELRSDSVEALDSNVQRMCEWVAQFVAKASQPATAAADGAQPPADDMPVG